MGQLAGVIVRVGRRRATPSLRRALVQEFAPFDEQPTCTHGRIEFLMTAIAGRHKAPHSSRLSVRLHVRLQYRVHPRLIPPAVGLEPFHHFPIHPQRDRHVAFRQDQLGGPESLLIEDRRRVRVGLSGVLDRNSGFI